MSALGDNLNPFFMRCPSTKLALSVTARYVAGRARVAGQKRGIGEEVRDALIG
jgi:hypothetical protein